MEESETGIAKKGQQEYVKLLHEGTEVPQISLFCDDVFKKTCDNVPDRVIQDITRLIVPSTETLATYGSTKLE